MKKNALVQLIVIYFGISSMYIGVSYLLPDIAAATAHLFGENNSRSYIEITYLVSFVLFILAGFIVVSKSGDISVYISEKASLDDSLNVYTKSSSLLSIFIVILALGHLLDYVPKLIRDIYRLFPGANQDRTLSYGGGDQEHSQLFNDFLNIILPCLMIIFCRNLTEYFSKNIVLSDNEIAIEHETITIETIDNADKA